MEEKRRLDTARKRWLLDAAELGDLDVVRTVLAAHPTLVTSAEPEHGYTALHLAAQAGHQEVVEFLLETSPELAAISDREGGTALHWAVQEGHMCAVNFLLDTRPELARVKNSDGETPFHTAALHDRYRILAALLRKFPECVQERDNQGAMAEDYAGANMKKLIANSRAHSCRSR